LNELNVNVLRRYFVILRRFFLIELALSSIKKCKEKDKKCLREFSKYRLKYIQQKKAKLKKGRKND